MKFSSQIYHGNRPKSVSPRAITLVRRVEQSSTVIPPVSNINFHSRNIRRTRSCGFNEFVAKRYRETSLVASRVRSTREKERGRKREREKERGKETVLSMPESIGPVSKHRSRIIRSKGEASTRHVTSTGNARRALIRSIREQLKPFESHLRYPLLSITKNSYNILKRRMLLFVVNVYIRWFFDLFPEMVSLISMINSNDYCRQA